LTSIIFRGDYHATCKNNSYQYWLPRLALYTGLRLNKLCQLHLSDIKEQNGIYLFDINDNQNITLKTASSKRQMPIHSKLIELGFLDRIKQLKHQKRIHLFPELNKTDKTNSPRASKWFARVQKQLGWINQTPKLDFHSFRHTVATRLQQHELPESRIASILGHEIGKSDTFNRYGKGYMLETLKADIQKLNFELVR